MRYTIFPHFYALGRLVCNSAIAPFSVCENADRFQNNVISRKTKSQVFITSCNMVECVNMQTENSEKSKQFTHFLEKDNYEYNKLCSLVRR